MGSGSSLPERVFPLIPPTFKRISTTDKCGSPDHIKILKNAERDHLKSCGGGPIHPLLQQGVFSNVDVMHTDVTAFFDHPLTDEFYQRLRPALRLATILLERGQSFFATIVLGKVFTHFDDDAEPWLALKPVLFDKLTHTEKAKYHEMIKNLAERTRICWLPSRVQGCHYTYGIADIAYLPFLSQLDSRIIHRLAVSEEIWQAFGGSNWTNKPLEQKYYLSLILAVTLVHEIGHLLWRNRSIRDDLDHIYYDEDGGIRGKPEPIIVPLYKNELGETWEMLQVGKMFSIGRKPSVNEDGDAHHASDSLPSGKTCLSEREYLDFNNIKGIRFGMDVRFRGITMDSVASLFMKSTWCDEFRVNRLIPLYIYHDEVSSSPEKLSVTKNNLCKHIKKNEPSRTWPWASKKVNRAPNASTVRGPTARIGMIDVTEVIRHPRARYDKAKMPKARATILDNHRSFLNIRAYDATQLPDTYTFGTEDDLIRTLESRTYVALWTEAHLDLSSLPEVIMRKWKGFDACDFHQNSRPKNSAQKSNAVPPTRRIAPFSQAESDLDTDCEMASSDADSNFDPDSEMSDAINDSESDTDTIKPNMPVDDDSDYYSAIENPSESESSDEEDDTVAAVPDSRYDLRSHVGPDDYSAVWCVNGLANLGSKWSVGEDVAVNRNKNNRLFAALKDLWK